MKKVRFGYGIALILLAIISFTGCPTPTSTPSTANANLSTLLLNDGAITLTPGFSSTVYNYTSTVRYSVASVKVSATAVSSNASVGIKFKGTTNITGSFTINLDVGVNTIVVEVSHTTESGTDTKTYNILITRQSGDEARLGSIIIKQNGTVATRLSPIFDSNTLTYNTGVTSTSTTASISVSPLDSYFSKVELNGVDITSTLSASLDLTNPTTTATIVVTAENQTTTKTYIIDIKKAASAEIPLALQVIESINGTKLGNVTYNVLDVNGNPIGSTGQTDASGSANINLEPNQYVTIITSKPDYASCTAQMIWVDALGNNSVTMVNQKLGMVTKDAGMSLINNLYISRQDNLADRTLIDPTDPNFILSMNGKTYLIFEFYSQNSIEATAGSGFGAKLGIDKSPTIFDGISGSLLGFEKLPSGAGFNYVTYYLFDVSNLQVTPGQHMLTVVAYDVANNRLQSSIPFALNPPSFSGTSITSAAFSAVTVDLRAFPLSRGYFGKKNDVTINALNQYLGNDISYRAAVSFKLLDGTNNVAIRGFDVYRSTDGTNWTKVGTVNYGALSTGSSGTHTYYDTDSALEADTTYYYKIRAFTDSANYKESDGTARAKLMAPFQANLSAPLNQTSFDYNPADMSGIPNFVFTISNTSLWNSAESDYFYFFLTIKEKSGDWKYIGRFRYNFSGSRFECKVGANWYSLISLGLDSTDIAYSAGTITIKAAVLLNGYSNAATGAAIEFEEGVTYEWDIYGDLQVLNGSSDHPAYFQKSYTGGVSRSYADVYSTGANTINGAFEFYVY